LKTAIFTGLSSYFGREFTKMQDGLLLKQPIVKIRELFDCYTPLAVFFKIILLLEFHGKN